MKTQVSAPDWCPGMIYTWTRAQIDAWADKHGSHPWYNGALWTIVYKRITPGRYEVRFKEFKP